MVMVHFVVASRSVDREERRAKRRRFDNAKVSRCEIKRLVIANGRIELAKTGNIAQRLTIGLTRCRSTKTERHPELAKH